MPTNLPIVFYILYALLAGGGVAGAAQMLSWVLQRNKHKPEIEGIVSEGARNAVEAMSIALTQANQEIKDLRLKLSELEDKYEVEIKKLVEQIENLKMALGEAEYNARRLAREVSESRAARTGEPSLNVQSVQ